MDIVRYESNINNYTIYHWPNVSYYMKALITFILILFISNPLLSQESIFSGGILAGLNGIQIAGDKEEKWGTGGVTAGVFVSSKIAKRISVQLEISYIQKGSIHPYVNDYGLQDWEVLRFHYVELPLILNYALQKKTNFLFIQGGFAYAYLFNKTFSKTRMNDLSPEAYINYYKNTDYSWIISFGYDINKGKLRNFSFMFRYSRSMVSIHQYLKQYNVVYGIMVLYTIRLKN